MAKMMFTEAKDVVPEKGHLFANPKHARMMRGMMRNMMNGFMKVTKHNNDCTQKEVSDFMVPTSCGNKFEDKMGTFDPSMEGRIRDTMMGGMMVMHRKVMENGPAPESKGITWEKYNEHRGYTTPGYQEVSPNVGDVAPDGPIHSINGGGASTLLAEARKAAEAAGSSRVVLSFVAVTCPFYRGYAAYDMHKAACGVPVVHVYIREAEPCDVFDAGGMHVTSPLAMRRRVYWHKNADERAKVARETQKFMEGFAGKGKVNMWMDGMDDALEATFEARPWRQYVIEAATGKIVFKMGLAPFNMAGKLRALKAACKANTPAATGASG